MNENVGESNKLSYEVSQLVQKYFEFLLVNKHKIEGTIKFKEDHKIDLIIIIETSNNLSAFIITLFFLFLFFIVLLFICAYKAWVISLPCPHPLPYHPLRP
jgi:hypothetical protein